METTDEVVKSQCLEGDHNYCIQHLQTENIQFIDPSVGVKPEVESANYANESAEESIFVPSANMSSVLETAITDMFEEESGLQSREMKEQERTVMEERANISSSSRRKSKLTVREDVIENMIGTITDINESNFHNYTQNLRKMNRLDDARKTKLDILKRYVLGDKFNDQTMQISEDGFLSDNSDEARDKGENRNFRKCKRTNADIVLQCSSNKFYKINAESLVDCNDKYPIFAIHDPKNKNKLKTIKRISLPQMFKNMKPLSINIVDPQAKDVSNSTLNWDMEVEEECNDIDEPIIETLEEDFNEDSKDNDGKDPASSDVEYNVEYLIDSSDEENTVEDAAGKCDVPEDIETGITNEESDVTQQNNSIEIGEKDTSKTQEDTGLNDVDTGSSLENELLIRDFKDKSKDTTSENDVQVTDIEGKSKYTALENDTQITDIEGESNDTAFDNDVQITVLEGKNKDVTSEIVNEDANLEKDTSYSETSLVIDTSFEDDATKGNDTNLENDASLSQNANKEMDTSLTKDNLEQDFSISTEKNKNLAKETTVEMDDTNKESANENDISMEDETFRNDTNKETANDDGSMNETGNQDTNITQDAADKEDVTCLEDETSRKDTSIENDTVIANDTIGEEDAPSEKDTNKESNETEARVITPLIKVKTIQTINESVREKIKERSKEFIKLVPSSSRLVKVGQEKMIKMTNSHKDVNLTIDNFYRFIKPLLNDCWVISRIVDSSIIICKMSVCRHLKPEILMSIVISYNGFISISVKGRRLQRTHLLLKNFCVLEGVTVYSILSLILHLDNHDICGGISLSQELIQENDVTECDNVIRSNNCKLLIDKNSSICVFCKKLGSNKSLINSKIEKNIKAVNVSSYSNYINVSKRKKWDMVNFHTDSLKWLEDFQMYIHDKAKTKTNSKDILFLNKYWSDVQSLFMFSLSFGAYSSSHQSTLQEKYFKIQVMLNRWRSVFSNTNYEKMTEAEVFIEPDEIDTNGEDLPKDVLVQRLRDYAKEIRNLRRRLKNKSTYISQINDWSIRRRKKQSEFGCRKYKVKDNENTCDSAGSGESVVELS